MLCSRSVVIFAVLFGAFSKSALADKSKFELSGYLIAEHSRQSGKLFDLDELDPGRGIALRKLKLSGEYDFTRSVSAELSLDYRSDENKFEIDDLYIAKDLTRAISLTLGRFKEPFGLENLQGLKYQYLQERSVASRAFRLGRNYGAYLKATGKRWNIDLSSVELEPDDDAIFRKYGESHTLRLSGLVYKKRKNFIHLGAGYNSRKPASRVHEIKEPLIGREVGNLIRSGDLDTALTIDTHNFEFAVYWNKLLLQAEYFKQKTDAFNSYLFIDEKVNFKGYYTSFLWAIFGEPRRYDDGEIKFRRSDKPTFELALRSSEVELEYFFDGDTAQTNEIALNYYRSSAIKLSAEYANADIEEYEFSFLSERSGDTFTLRLQIALN